MTREMKDSGVEWIGEIPREWEVKKANKICNTITDYVASGSFASLSENVKYLDEPNYAMLIRTADVSNKGYKSKPVYVDEHAYNFLKNSNLYGGELLLPNIGGVGEVYVVPKLYEKMTLAPNAIIIRTDYCDKYYYYYFCSDAGFISIKEISQSTAQPKFNKTDFRQIKVLLPPLQEQEKIADFLDGKVTEIDKIISETKASIENYKEYKQLVITEAVTKGLDKNVPMKETDNIHIPLVPEHWGFKKMKYLFYIKKDIAGREGYKILSITQKGIKVKNISANEGQLADSYVNYQIVKIGDFAMNHMDLLTGWVDVSQYDGVTSPDYRVFNLIEPEKHNKYYYLYLMQICYTNKIFYGLGQGVSNLGRWRLQADKFLNFTIPEPPMEEQNTISSYLNRKNSEIDNLISEKEKLIMNLEEYKKSLIYEYVTGKKAVE